jgi:hypothetical protein
MDFESIINMPVIGQIITHAIEGGRDWGQTFLQDSSWGGDRERMANHAIYESTLWSVGNGIGNGFLGIAGIPSEVSIFLYSQVKLASALFSIYGIDISQQSTQPLVLAAAAGVGMTELASQLGTQAAKKAIQKALTSMPAKAFLGLNKFFGFKIISKTAQKSLVSVAKIIPFVSSAVSGTVNGVMMNKCGHSVMTFIKEWEQS